MERTSGEIIDLTLCRAAFAGWVFAYHVDLHAHFAALLGPAAGLVRRGYLGVDGFFLLSGLILARVHPELGRSPDGSWRFWVKRLARIYPVHVAVILLLAAVTVTGMAIGLNPRDPGRFSLAALLENLLLIHGWGVANQLAWNYPSWSVSTEWAGYLLFPALWLGIARLPARFAGLAALLCLGGLALVDWRSPHGLNLTFAWSLSRFFPEFILGMATAGLLPVLAPRARKLVLAGASVILFGLLGGPDCSVVFGLWLLLAGFAARAQAGRPGLLPPIRVLRFLGVLSYAFYMSFASIELFLAQLYRHEGWDPAGDKLAYAAAMTGFTFILALSLHHLVENPARRWVDRLLAGSSPVRHPPVRAAS